MREPVGFSHLFPAVPILNAISIVLLLSIFPSFLKTKVFTLVAVVILLILGNFFSFLNMIIWRNNVRDIPLYSDFVTHWVLLYTPLLYISFTCFAKFVWYMSRPGSALFLYDNRRKINKIDAMILVGAVVVFLPSNLFTLARRYNIVEDIGPWPQLYFDMKAVLISLVPCLVLAITSVVFNVLTLRNNIIRKRKQLNRDNRMQSNSHINKHLLLAASSSVIMLFKGVWMLYPLAKIYFPHISDREAYPYLFVPISEVIRTIHQKMFSSRIILDSQPLFVTNLSGFLLTIPLSSIYIFGFFGLGKEAMKMHRDNFSKLVRLLHMDKENTGGQLPEGEIKPSIWNRNFLKHHLLPNHNSESIITPLHLPISISYPPRRGPKSNLEIAGNTNRSAKVDASRPSDPSKRRKMPRIPLLPATLEVQEQELDLVTIQAPPNTNGQLSEGEMKPSRWNCNFLRRHPLPNHNSKSVITPLHLPSSISHPPRRGSKSNAGIASNMDQPAQVDASRPSGPSKRRKMFCIPLLPATVEIQEQKPNIVTVQAPPPAYVPRPQPSKTPG